jgi:hypothetical protein
MLPKKHQYYTLVVCDLLGVKAGQYKQINLGSIANDYCEFTDEQLKWRSKEEFPRSPVVLGKMLLNIAFLNCALYESHFGYLASLHAMSKAPGESADTTLSEVKMWFEFLNGVALGKLNFDPDKKIGDGISPIRSLFNEGGIGSIEYHQIFGTDDPFMIRDRAIGMMLHLIQDSYTPSHCLRDENGNIERFYAYARQDRSKHGEDDDVDKNFKDKMLSNCRDCVEQSLNGKWYGGYISVFPLSTTARYSDGGDPYS